jgi:hypothetical protein
MSECYLKFCDNCQRETIHNRVKHEFSNSKANFYLVCTECNDWHIDEEEECVCYIDWNEFIKLDKQTYSEHYEITMTITYIDEDFFNKLFTKPKKHKKFGMTILKKMKNLKNYIHISKIDSNSTYLIECSKEQSILDLKLFLESQMLFDFKKHKICSQMGLVQYDDQKITNNYYYIDDFGA